jgi:beta propeller repeat protein
VRDLAAGFTFRIDSTDAGNQYFPHTDDDHVVWQDDRDGRREVYMYTISTGVEECLTPDSWEQAWPHLRDGIVSWCDYRFSQESGQNGRCDIYVYEIATGVGRRVTSESRTWMPRFVDSGWMMYGLWIIGHRFKLYMHDLVNDGILTPDGHVIP